MDSLFLDHEVVGEGIDIGEKESNVKEGIDGNGGRGGSGGGINEDPSPDRKGLL